MNKIYNFKNVSGQMFFITELNKRISSDSKVILTVTEEDITRSQFLSDLIAQKKLARVTQEEAYGLDSKSSTDGFFIEGDTTRVKIEPDPHGNTERPRSVLVDEKSQRNILVDNSNQSRSIYDTSIDDSIKKK